MRDTTEDEGGAALIEIEHCWIPMQDGVRLSARIWRPADEAPTPAILEYIPYRKRDMVRARDERNHPVFARAGYACLRVDMRGSGDSEGVMADMYTAAEQDDAIAVIEWIATQDWCDGSVGMMGTSWGGTASLQAAARRPAALKAVIAVCATDDRFEDDIHLMGGCVLTDTVEWGATLPAILALPPDPDTVGPGWREIWLKRLEAATFPVRNWVSHRAKNAYWRNGSVSATPGAITCPTLAIGGWVDRYSSSVMDLAADNPNSVWGVIGPWGHHYPDQGQPGPAMDFQRVALNWWDHWLRGVDTGADRAPRLRVWMRGFDQPCEFRTQSTGRWVIAADDAPKQERGFGLQEDGVLGPGSGSGSGSGPGRGAATIPFSLRAGLAAGDTGYFGRIGGLPSDQSEDDARSLTFETPPLSEPLELFGPATLSFRIDGATPASMIAARLVDIGPNGAARIAFAVRDLTLDNALAAPRDSDAPIVLRFPNTAYRVEAGHRLRLSFSTSYWPTVMPNASSSAIKIDLDGARLTLPLFSGETDASPPLTAPPGSAREADGPERETVATADRVQCRWRQPPRRMVFPDIGVTISAETKAEHCVELDDPLTATTAFEHRITLERGDSDFLVIGEARLRPTATGLAPEGALTLYENGAEIFCRKWAEEAHIDGELNT